MNDYVLELKDVVKTFGAVKALNGVQFHLKKGEVHALMGENGAGKSTFIKVITGVHQPDSGIMKLNGEIVNFHSTVDSQAAGIAAIYQNVTSFPDLTVTENIFMGQEIKTKLHTYNWGAMRKKAQELIDPLTSEIDVTRPMYTLSIAQQQLVEIAKALSHKAQIIIMDEPTASLSKSEQNELYNIVDRLRDSGVSVIFITHRFEDMWRVASRVTVFRDSQYIGEWDLKEIDEPRLIEAMVGRTLDQMYPDKTAEIGDVILKVEGLSKMGYFKDVSFDLKKGEILGLTGLVGAGRSEVCMSLFGMLPADHGKIFLEGKEIRINTPYTAFTHGIGLLPEDRQTEGLMELPIYQNVTAADLKKFSKFGVLNISKERDATTEICNRILLKTRSVIDPPSSLSGGNQQKVVFAKLLNVDLKILILDEPTKGIDVGAKKSVYEIMNELASNGYSIIMVSSEMPEVFGMSDRIVVMRSGRVVAHFDDMESATPEAVLAASVTSQDEIEEGA